eukprot:TRINITY_DN10227_c0_g1_i5.p1 TRINITY_DN10227_c0_g1~~TRINITY_DN10227_c0_g1_i5.p1  ORF type:complete len:793 (+),score=117.30 TRINITY_DN10227_c0_g1_i5:2-2380(+)
MAEPRLTIEPSRLELDACACSPTTGSLKWQPNGELYAYCASETINVVQTKNKSKPHVERCLQGHKARTNCLAWLDNGETSSLLASGDSKGNVLVWDVTKTEPCIAQLQSDNQASIVAVTQLPLDDHLLLAVATAQHTCLICAAHKSDPSQWALWQTLNFGKHYALSLALARLAPEGPYMLAAGLTDCKLHLFVSTTPDIPAEGPPFSFAEVDVLSGHDDWIRALAPLEIDGSVLVASASQDAYIRLWKIEPTTADTTAEKKGFAALLETSERKFGCNWQGSVLTYKLKLESLLIGHEGHVYGLDWAPNSKEAEPVLLSSSADKTILLWKYDDESGVWIDDVRLGEVGGTTLGFFGAVFSPQADCILAHGYQGALHMWCKESEHTWSPQVVVGGHFQSVRELAWAPSGNYLVSVSDDQTARLYAPWQDGWKEIARPQVHGHNMRCLAFVNEITYVSGADEKVVRAFRAPRTFADSIQAISNIDYRDLASDLSYGASVSALGLTNKAVDESAAQPQEPAAPSYRAGEDAVLPSVPVVTKVPPPEEHLLQNSLWPEQQKLYGHGYEILSVACNHAGTIVATTCKATQPQHAVIRLWDTTSWKELAALEAHKLSVVHLAFSPDDRWLVSVSRDRCIGLFQRSDDGAMYELTQLLQKAHDRIIWSCAWSKNGQFLITGSRDKTLKVWSVVDGALAIKGVHKLDASVNTVSATMRHGQHLVAAGLENGIVELLYIADDGTPSHMATVPKPFGHAAAVTCVRFRPDAKDQAESQVQLATASVDHHVKILNFTVRSSTLV